MAPGCLWDSKTGHMRLTCRFVPSPVQMRERTDEREHDEVVPYVETARGPVELSSLGRVLMHEHIFVTTPEVQASWVPISTHTDAATRRA